LNAEGGLNMDEKFNEEEFLELWEYYYKTLNGLVTCQAIPEVERWNFLARYVGPEGKKSLMHKQILHYIELSLVGDYEDQLQKEDFDENHQQSILAKRSQIRTRDFQEICKVKILESLGQELLAHQNFTEYCVSRNQYIKKYTIYQLQELDFGPVEQKQSA
jgi:hypothetical protein